VSEVKLTPARMLLSSGTGKTCKWAYGGGRTCTRPVAVRSGPVGREPDYCGQSDGPRQPAHNKQTAWKREAALVRPRKVAAAKGEHAPCRQVTLREACVLVTGMLGRPTARQVHEFLAGDGWEVTLGTVKQAFYRMRGGPVDVADRQGRWAADRWRLTEAGRAWLMEGERCG